VFEALACGIPLICAPWNDCEGLFRPGADYLIAPNSAEMRSCMHALVTDKDLHAAVAESGLDRILARHTCAHRADQLLSIVSSMQPELAGAA
jgi:spore maturation protein CgeB